jgi:D-alanyl-D-alanine carboxypeptidase/D-alanyl-D-alanine-endopeptidase (penicillin-binding protein 4)
MRRWVFPAVLVLIAAFAAFQAVQTDQALADEQAASTAPPQTSTLTPLFSVRRTPNYLREPSLFTNLSNDLDDVATLFPVQSCLVVIREGEEIYLASPDVPLVPASAQKVLTAYGVYELLGEDHTFTTRVVSDVPIVDGVLDGDVYLVGGGDPLLATDDYALRYTEPEAFTDLERLADALVNAGLTEITGAVIGDETRYDAERYNPNWPDRFTNLEQNQTGPLSALTVNDGFVRFDPSNTANSLSTASEDPAVFAAAFFDDLLEARDVVIRRSAASGSAPGLGIDLVPGLESVAAEVVTNQMLTVSDNMGSELLLKEIGLVAGEGGTTVSGAEALEELLTDRGLPTENVGVVDGSGLAEQNRVTCRLLAEVLSTSRNSVLIDGLAVMGETGTLSDRLLGSPAVGRVKAKTGRLNNVGALAGIATAEDESELVFAWIGNTTDFYPVEEMLAVQDRLALELIEFPEGPSVELLAPKRQE